MKKIVYLEKKLLLLQNMNLCIDSIWLILCSIKIYLMIKNCKMYLFIEWYLKIFAKFGKRYRCVFKFVV